MDVTRPGTWPQWVSGGEGGPSGCVFDCVRVCVRESEGACAGWNVRLLACHHALVCICGEARRSQILSGACLGRSFPRAACSAAGVGWGGEGFLGGTCDGVYVRVSAGLPLLSTLRCCDCHDMCLNTVTPLLTHAHSHARAHTVASCIFFFHSSKVPHINKGLLFCEWCIFAFSSASPILFSS